MKKILFLLFSVVFSALAFSVQAEDVGRLEIGISAMSPSASSSPVTAIGVSGKTGVSLRGVVGVMSNVDLTLGISSQGFKLNMAGRPLGNVDSTVISATARYKFGDSSDVRPYVGAGVHMSSFDGTLGGGTLRVNGGDGFGVLAEVGVTAKIPDGFFFNSFPVQLFL